MDLKNESPYAKSQLLTIKYNQLFIKILIEDKIDINGDKFINDFDKIVEELNELHQNED